MRLLLVSFVADNRWTGMGKWTYKVAEHLRTRGHEVELWFADRFPRLNRAGRLGTVLFPGALAAGVARAARRFDAIVVHEPAGVAYGMLRRLCPDLPPMVLMCHNVESKNFRVMQSAADRGWAEVGRKNRLMFQLLRRHLSDGAIRLADRVICLSRRDWVYITGRLCRRPSDVFRQVNGVDESYFLRRTGYQDPPRIIFVGGWLDVKGKRLLPRIWERVSERFPSATLTIVGTGCSADVVQADFRESARGSLRVIPRVESEADIIDQYRNHDIFLMSSLSEGSPLSLLEAMAGGLAVVATAVGGIPDIVRSGTDGLLFPGEDVASGASALARLMLDPVLVTRLGLDGQRRARALTWEATAASLEAAAAAAVNDTDGGIWSGRPGSWPPGPERKSQVIA